MVKEYWIGSAGLACPEWQLFKGRLMHTNWIQDTHALLDSSDTAKAPTRRLALQTALGLGYAASAMPLIAQTAIKTSGEGLTEGEITTKIL